MLTWAIVYLHIRTGGGTGLLLLIAICADASIIGYIASAFGGR